ncbi:MAG: DNA methyltransferase, partial [Chthoniobacterales bacterium]
MTEFDLRLGDCVAGMAKLPDESIDLVVTSPPYNLGIRYGKFSDAQSRESYLDWCVEWATQIRRRLKPDGSLFLNIGAAPANPLLPHELMLRLRDIFVL